MCYSLGFNKRFPRGTIQTSLYSRACSIKMRTRYNNIMTHRGQLTTRAGGLDEIFISPLNGYSWALEFAFITDWMILLLVSLKDYRATHFSAQPAALLLLRCCSYPVCVRKSKLSWMYSKCTKTQREQLLQSMVAIRLLPKFNWSARNGRILDIEPMAKATCIIRWRSVTVKRRS